MYEAPSPLLLSRVAESSYWAGRYIERAEGTARLIRSHAELVIDLPASAFVGWRPLLAVLGAGTDFDENHEHASEEEVTRHLAASTENSGSIRSSVSAVHQNLRITRSVMPIEAAEVLTDLHRHVESTAYQAVDRRTRSDWLTSVIRQCQTLTGIMADTMSHDDAFCFFTVGRQLERADLVTRVLDVEAAVLTGRAHDALVPYQDLCWAAALRSVSALQAFRRRSSAHTPEATIAFLLRDPRCPRTVESCLVEASRWLLEIPRHEDAMAACASVGTLLQGVDMDDLMNGGLHEFVDELQLAISELHDRIGETWFQTVPTAVGVES
ncbi:MAG: alpha-E domain-containing protein [Actinomycetota bacterium]